jgi:hypothetical protein
MANQHFDGPDRRERKRIRFEPIISLGHVLTVTGMLLGGATAWNAMDKRIAMLEEAKKTQELRDGSQDQRANDRYVELKDTMTEVKRGVEKIVERMDKGK